MFNKINKKTITITICIIVTVAIGIAALSLMGGKPHTAELPVVNENVVSQAPAPEYNAVNPEPTVSGQDNPSAGLPVSDSDPALVITEPAQPIETAAPDDVKEAETKVVEKTPEQVAADNKKIEDAKAAAESNPDTQKVDVKPVVTEPAPPTPKTYADGSMYTKQEAVEMFKKAFQKKIDNNSSAYIDALDAAKMEDDFSQEAFNADVNQMMNDPYSSPVLKLFFDDYRKSGDLGLLIVSCSEWLSLGGDDGEVANRFTN